MHKFYLTSECTPIAANLKVYTQHFENTLLAYDSLVSNPKLQVESGVVTEKLPHELQVGSDFSLGDVINSISDKKVKALAYSYFIKFPIESHVEGWEEQYEEVEANAYCITIAGNRFDVFLLAFVALDKGFGFTVPVHDDLKKDMLTFVSSGTAPNLELYHLYGNLIANTTTVKTRIQDLNAKSFSIFEQLMALLNDPIYDERHFKKAFEALSLDIKESILRKFKDAVNQNTIDHPDSNTVKDVTPSKNKCTVLELRVYTPVGVRLYFNKTGGTIYLGSIEHKSNSDQNKDIKDAHTILYNLILENS